VGERLSVVGVKDHVAYSPLALDIGNPPVKPHAIAFELKAVRQDVNLKCLPSVLPREDRTWHRQTVIRLTLGVYTHLELNDQTMAVATLPGPPDGNRLLTAGSEERSVA
jgi:hypothetical protein